MKYIILPILLLTHATIVAIPPQLDDLLCHECDFCEHQAVYRDPMPLIDLYTKCDLQNGTNRRVKKPDEPDVRPDEPPTSYVDEVEKAPPPVDLEELKSLQQDKELLLAELEAIREERDALKDNFKTANRLVETLQEEKRELKLAVEELEEKSNKQPGSLFSGWVYTAEMDWIYTSPTIYPYAFSQHEGWLKYEISTNPRRVYYFRTNKWVMLSE